MPNLGSTQTSPTVNLKEGDDWRAESDSQSAIKASNVDLGLTLPHKSVVCSVHFSADGHFLATGCNRTTQIYDVNTGSQVCVLEDLHTPGSKLSDMYIRGVRFSPDSSLLATGGEDNKIRIWDLSSRTIRRVLTGHEKDIYALDFAPHDGRHLASGSGDKTLRLWDLATEECIVITVGGVPHLDSGLTSVAFSPDGTAVAAGSLDYNVRVWSAADGTLLRVLRGHEESVYSVAWAPSGTSIVSGSLDNIIKIWGWNWDDTDLGLSVADRELGKAPPLSLLGHKDFVLAVCVSHDGRYIFSGSKDRSVRVWDALTGAFLVEIQGHKNSVISLAPSPGGGTFATASGDRTARIWKYASTIVDQMSGLKLES